MSACEHCGHELAGAIATVEECDEDAPLRNMAPLAVRVPRLPVRRPEARPSPIPAIIATVVGVGIWVVVILAR